MRQKFEGYLQERRISKNIRKVIKEELEKFNSLNENEMEYNNTKQYLEEILRMPLGIHTEDSTDLGAAEKTLNSTHFGMDEVKKRIQQFLAIGKLKGDFVQKKILCLVGPPGTGKTTIAKSIASSLGRSFQRIALGGESDISILKGHRRTYVGSYPGKIVNALKLSKSMNPVILLDEIDKLGRSVRGNLQDVLLEILDPKQNDKFDDHYMEFSIDLSRVLFLCSANILDQQTVSDALYDRMEVIEISGYTKEEKLQIFERYMLKRLKDKLGIEKYNLKVEWESGVVSRIIEEYAREPGIRGFEKRVRQILEKVVHKFVKTEEIEKFKLGREGTKQEYALKVEGDKLRNYLGP